MSSDALEAYDVVSEFHLLGIILYAFKNESIKEVNIHAQISQSGKKNLQEGSFAINEKIINIKYDNLNFSKWQLFKNLIRLIFRRVVNNNFSVVHVGHHTYVKPVFVVKKNKIKTFTYEEGVGTYGNFIHHFKVHQREGKKYYFLKTVTKFFLRNDFFVDERVNLLHFKNIEDRKCMADAMAKLIESEFVSKFIFSDSSFALPLGSVIFFGSPFVKLKIMSEDEYLLVMERILSKLKKYSPEVYYKPHPLEVDCCYMPRVPAILLSDYKFPELRLLLEQPSVVSGFSSTILIFANHFCRSIVYSFNQFLPPRVQKMVVVNGEIAQVMSKIQCHDL